MSINSFLNQKSNELIIRDSEKDSIKKSVDTLKSWIVYHFANSKEFLDHTLEVQSYQDATMKAQMLT